MAGAVPSTACLAENAVGLYVRAAITTLKGGKTRRIGKTGMASAAVSSARPTGKTAIQGFQPPAAASSATTLISILV